MNDDLGLKPAAEGEWTAQLDERWNVGRNQNGGILLATAASALAAVTGQPHPFAITGHFLAAAEAGPATVRARAVKPGRTYATAEAELWQGDRERLRVVGSFGDLRQRSAAGPEALPVTGPELPPPERCDDLFDLLVAGPAGERSLTKSLQNYEIRVDPDTGWSSPGRGDARLRGWVRLRGDNTVTPQMLIAMADGLPPTMLSQENTGWLPTIELSVHIFREPPPGEPWLRAELYTRSVIGGLLDEDGELFDAAGNLVARFRQLAMVIPRD